MNGETIFRILVAVGVALGFAQRIYFNRRAGNFRTSLEQQQEGILLPINGLLMIGWLVVLILYLVNPAWVAWARMHLPAWLRWTGVGLAAVAAPFFYWVHDTLDKGFSGTVYVREDHVLVQDGPYRWIRHPMYTAYVLVHLSYMLMTASWFIGLTGLATIGLIMVFRVSKEEAAMIDRFGDEYRSYVKRTGRFLPHF